MASLVRLAHHVEYSRILFHVEVEVDLHTTLMSVARHGVPQTAFLQLGHAHYQLAGRQYIRHQVFVDGATVAGRRVTDSAGGSLLLGDLAGREMHVGRSTVVVKLGRLRGINAGKT
ncbi:hypothetical protein D3C71_1685730 [compost metagenome]